jgi:hypothetical protein
MDCHGDGRVQSPQPWFHHCAPGHLCLAAEGQTLATGTQPSFPEISEKKLGRRLSVGVEAGWKCLCSQSGSLQQWRNPE